MDAADDAVKEAWEENAAAAALRVAADQLYAENLPSCDGASTSLHDGESLLNPFYSTPRKHTAATSRNDARTRAGTSQRIGRTPRSHALTPAAAAHPEAGRAHRTPLDRDLDLGDDAQPHFAKLRAADCTGLQEARSRVCHLRDMWEQNHARHSQRQIEIRDLYAQCGGPESQTPREMRGGDGQVMTSLTSPRGLTSESSDRHRKPQDKLFVITSLAEGHGGENLKQTTVYPDAAFQVQDTAFNSLLNERTRSLGSGDGQMPTHRSHLAQRMHTNKLALQSEIILERTVFNGGSATLRRARRVRGGGDEKDARKVLTPREHPTTGNARRSLLAHEGGGDLQLLGESDLPSRRPRRLEGQGGALATGVCQTRDRDVDGGRTEGGVSTRRIEDKGNYGQKRGKSEAGATVWADTAVVFSQPETYTALRRESLPVPSSTSEASDMKETVLRASHARRTQSEALVTAAVKQNSSMTPRTSVSEAKVSYRERLEDAQKVAAQKDLHLDAGERPLVYSKAKDFVVPLVEIGFMASAMNVMQRRPMSLEMKTSAEMEAIRMELLKVNPELETSRFPALKSSCPSVGAEETTHHEVKGDRPTGAVTERHRHNERPTGISMTARDHLRQSTPGWHDKEISTDASHKCKNPQGSWVPRATAMRMSAKKHVGSEEQPFRKLIHNKGQIDWSAGVSGMGKGAKIMQASYADWIRVCDTYPVSPRRVPDLAALGNHPKVGMIELGPVMGGDRRQVKLTAEEYTKQQAGTMPAVDPAMACEQSEKFQKTLEPKSSPRGMVYGYAKPPWRPLPTEKDKPDAAGPALSERSGTGTNSTNPDPAIKRGAAVSHEEKLRQDSSNAGMAIPTFDEAQVKAKHGGVPHQVSDLSWQMSVAVNTTSKTARTSSTRRTRSPPHSTGGERIRLRSPDEGRLLGGRSLNSRGNHFPGNTHTPLALTSAAHASPRAQGVGPDLLLVRAVPGLVREATPPRDVILAEKS